MRFPIDVVFVDREGRVVSVRRNLQPWRISLALGAYAAVELEAGAAQRADTRVADHLQLFSELSPRP